jgi:translocator protein
MKLAYWQKLIISILLSFLAGIIGSLFTIPSIDNWYTTLNKPDFFPPNWIFAPVWNFLYLLMGIALSLVWHQGWNNPKVKTAMYIFGAQLVLNTLWSIIFFALKNPGAALIEIALMWLAILLTIFYFSKVSRLAAGLLVPYILWVTFATYLNYSIWQLNR